MNYGPHRNRQNFQRPCRSTPETFRQIGRTRLYRVAFRFVTFFHENYNTPPQFLAFAGRGFPIVLPLREKWLPAEGQSGRKMSGNTIRPRPNTAPQAWGVRCTCLRRDGSWPGRSKPMMSSNVRRKQSCVSKQGTVRIAFMTAALLVILGVGSYLTTSYRQQQQRRRDEAADTLLLKSLNPPTALDRGNAIWEIHAKDETLGILSMWVRIAQLKEACGNWCSRIRTASTLSRPRP